MDTNAAPMRPDVNYIGIEFGQGRWDYVRRCCIFPPDAAFAAPLRDRDDGCERVLLFWHMDEPDAEHRDSGQKRPRLHTIFAAFRELYQRSHAGRYEAITLHMLRRRGAASFEGDALPGINFRLWQSARRLEEHWDDAFERGLPPALPPLRHVDCRAAKKAWMELVAQRVEFLMASMTDARSYEMLLPMLTEWYGYGAQLDVRCLDWNVEMARLQFYPWYAEVLRRMPRLNEKGLTLIPLPSAHRFAVLDYRPEEGRRFRYEAATEPHMPGKLQPASPEDEALPYDAAKQLHLLPVPCESRLDYVWVTSVDYCPFYEEDWLGKDYRWDRPFN